MGIAYLYIYIDIMSIEKVVFFDHVRITIEYIRESIGLNMVNLSMIRLNRIDCAIYHIQRIGKCFHHYTMDCG